MSHNKENGRPLHNRLSLSIQRQSLQPRSLVDPIKPTAPISRPPLDFSRRLADVQCYSGPDPLTQWCSLYQWTSTNQPTSLQTVLESALDSLQSHPSYPSSPQYVGLWVAYARLCPDPLPFYTDMYTQGVGSALTVLYTEWADALEREGQWDEADGVYMKGLLRQAQPLMDLIERFDAFKKRGLERKKLSDTAEPSKKRGAATQEEPLQQDTKQAKTATTAEPPPPGLDRSV